MNYSSTNLQINEADTKRWYRAEFSPAHGDVVQKGSRIIQMKRGPDEVLDSFQEVKRIEDAFDVLDV